MSYRWAEAGVRGLNPLKYSGSYSGCLCLGQEVGGGMDLKLTVRGGNGPVSTGPWEEPKAEERLP